MAWMRVFSAQLFCPISSRNHQRSVARHNMAKTPAPCMNDAKNFALEAVPFLFSIGFRDRQPAKSPE